MISQGWLAEPLRQIGGAGSNMRSIYDASETAYQAIVAVEVAPQVLVWTSVLEQVVARSKENGKALENE